jgi:hypothetical protein
MIKIKGKRQYICIPDDRGVYNELPVYLDYGADLMTNYDEIKKINQKELAADQNVLSCATINYSIDLLKSKSKITSEELDEKLLEYKDSGTFKKGINVIIENVVFIYDEILKIFL